MKVAVDPRGPVRLTTFRTMSTAQRVGVIVLVVVGVVAAVYAFEYLTVSIHALPSWVPGRHHGRGHYHKRGAIFGVIAVGCLAGAGFLIYKARRGRGVGSGPEAPVAAATGTPDAGTLLGDAKEASSD